MRLSSYHVIQLKKNPPKNAVHIYDGMVIVRSVASQKTWGDLWTLLLKCFTPNSAHNPSKVHIVFDNYTDNQTFSVKQTKRVRRAADEGKWLHIGNDSQEMPQGDNYKDFLKNNSNKADLIRRFNKFVKRDVPHLHLDYPLVITLEKEAWEILSRIYLHLIKKKWTLALCSIALWRINQQWELQLILIS